MYLSPAHHQSVQAAPSIPHTSATVMLSKFPHCPPPPARIEYYGKEMAKKYLPEFPTSEKPLRTDAVASIITQTKIWPENTREEVFPRGWNLAAGRRGQEEGRMREGDEREKVEGPPSKLKDPLVRARWTTWMARERVVVLCWTAGCPTRMCAATAAAAATAHGEALILFSQELHAKHNESLSRSLQDQVQESIDRSIVRWSSQWTLCNLWITVCGKGYLPINQTQWRVSHIEFHDFTECLVGFTGIQ